MGRSRRLLHDLIIAAGLGGRRRPVGSDGAILNHQTSGSTYPRTYRAVYDGGHDQPTGPTNRTNQPDRG
jgi:hypothetical protein